MPDPTPHFVTAANFRCEIPGATAAELKRAEEIMRSAPFIREYLEMTNELAAKHNAASGFHKAVHITGDVGTVTHHP